MLSLTRLGKGTASGHQTSGVRVTVPRDYNLQSMCDKLLTAAAAGWPGSCTLRPEVQASEATRPGFSNVCARASARRTR